MTHETQTLDKLYLEWSQFTTARTRRELILAAAVNKALEILDGHPQAYQLQATSLTQNAHFHAP